jgi:ribose transport system ATP-binding protein
VVTADQSLAGVDGQSLVRLMVGRDPGDLFPPHQPRKGGERRIDIRGFAAGIVRDVDFTASAGEIVGIGGLVGQGQEDFLLGLYGAIPASASHAEISGRPGLASSVGSANALGLAYVPADRKKEGLVLSHSIAANLLLPSLGQNMRNGLRDRPAEKGLVASLAQRLSIKGDTGRAVQALSGGNQQKVALAKWLPKAPSILLLNDPTRGVDIETKREIYLMLQGFAAEGKLVILLSSDTPELVHLCDRVLVFSEGRVVRTLERSAITEEAIVGAAMGLDRSEAA